MAVDRLDPPVRAALRLGLYQLLFLDRVPAYGGADASGRLARVAGAGASGLVNAVLRRAAALGGAGLALPPVTGDPLGRLAVEWSHPRWLVARWADEFGPEALPALLAANNERAPTALRANRTVTTRDALHAPLAGAFDAVLVDAPCSGLGTLRRHPELRWRRRPEDIPRFAALQQQILAGVAPLVRPRGVLVYAVCTLASEENEQVVGALSAAHPRFVVEDVRDHLPPAAAPLADGKGFLRTLPHLHGLDGFFAARLRARN